MSQQVYAGAELVCSLGSNYSNLIIASPDDAEGKDRRVANIMDSIAVLNIVSFGLCSSINNPAVAAATTADIPPGADRETGTGTNRVVPQPCLPLTVGSWSPGAAHRLANGLPALTDTCTLKCAFGGTIGVKNPGSV